MAGKIFGEQPIALKRARTMRQEGLVVAEAEGANRGAGKHFLPGGGLRDGAEGNTNPAGHDLLEDLHRPLAVAADKEGQPIELELRKLEPRGRTQADADGGLEPRDGRQIDTG